MSLLIVALVAIWHCGPPGTLGPGLVGEVEDTSRTNDIDIKLEQHDRNRVDIEQPASNTSTGSQAGPESNLLFESIVSFRDRETHAILRKGYLVNSIGGQVHPIDNEKGSVRVNAGNQVSFWLISPGYQVLRVRPTPGECEFMVWGSQSLRVNILEGKGLQPIPNAFVQLSLVNENSGMKFPLEVPMEEGNLHSTFQGYTDSMGAVSFPYLKLDSLAFRVGVSIESEVKQSEIIKWQDFLRAEAAGGLNIIIGGRDHRFGVMNEISEMPLQNKSVIYEGNRCVEFARSNSEGLVVLPEVWAGGGARPQLEGVAVMVADGRWNVGFHAANAQLGSLVWVAIPDPAISSVRITGSKPDYEVAVLAFRPGDSGHHYPFPRSESELVSWLQIPENGSLPLNKGFFSSRSLLLFRHIESGVISHVFEYGSSIDLPSVHLDRSGRILLIGKGVPPGAWWELFPQALGGSEKLDPMQGKALTVNGAEAELLLPPGDYLARFHWRGQQLYEKNIRLNGAEFETVQFDATADFSFLNFDIKGQFSGPYTGMEVIIESQRHSIKARVGENGRVQIAAPSSEDWAARVTFPVIVNGERQKKSGTLSLSPSEVYQGQRDGQITLEEGRIRIRGPYDGFPQIPARMRLTQGGASRICSDFLLDFTFNAKDFNEVILPTSSGKLFFFSGTPFEQMREFQLHAGGSTLLSLDTSEIQTIGVDWPQYRGGWVKLKLIIRDSSNSEEFRRVAGLEDFRPNGNSTSIVHAPKTSALVLELSGSLQCPNGEMIQVTPVEATLLPSASDSARRVTVTIESGRNGGSPVVNLSLSQ